MLRKRVLVLCLLTALAGAGLLYREFNAHRVREIGNSWQAADSELETSLQHYTRGCLLSLFRGLQDSIHTPSFKYSASQLKSSFLSGATVWRVISEPLLLDLPQTPRAVLGGKLVMLRGLKDVVEFYNSHLDSGTLRQEPDYTLLAEEILRLAYFKQEFGYNNNTNYVRGYRVISSTADINGFVERDEPLPVSPPITVQLDGQLYHTKIWFWGRHNCELHRFTANSDNEGIKDFSDELIASTGKCVSLAYE